MRNGRGVTVTEAGLVMLEHGRGILHQVAVAQEELGSVRGALIAALLVGLVDTFGKVLLPQISGMLVYVLMAAVLLYKPEGLFKQ